MGLHAAVTPSAFATGLTRLRAALPQGRRLPEDVWHRRHNGILVLLWAHAAAIPVYALVQGASVLHSVLEGAIVPAAAAVAMRSTLSRGVRTVMAAFGLLSSSAVLVHLSGGLIEMHFHFFVMVAVVALYQDWLPFLTAIGYVFVHHGLMGAIDAGSVYNHPAARNNPWLWAAVHALFVTGISVACLVTWRLNERMLAERRSAEDRLREESRITASLHEVGKVLSADLDTERVVQAVTDAATELTAAEFGAFFYNVTDDRGEAYMLYTLSGAPKDAFERFGLPRNTPMFAATFSGEGVVRVDDVTEDPRYGTLPPHHGMPKGHLPVRSYLAVPVRSRDGTVLGGLFFGHQERGRFNEVDERIVVGIAAQATVALDNARLYESEREARGTAEAAGERLVVLAEASRILASSLEVDAILCDLGALVATAVADFCVIDVVEDDRSLRRLVSGSTADAHRAEILTDPPAPDDRDDPVIQAMGTQRPVVVDGDARDTPSTVVAPMVGREGVLGALTLGVLAGSGRRLGAADVQFAEELARRAAFAIENARLYTRQRSVAETLQHSLLPDHLPFIPGIDAAVRYLAGGPGVEVGGDWYDILQLPDGRVVVAIGDVVGRGERAASLMGQMRNAVRAYAIDGKPPREIVACVNRLIIESGQEHMATALVAVLELETGALTYATAGHLPPLVATSDGSGRFLEPVGGLPVGAFAGARYTDNTVVLEPGDTLVLYTDGLVEERTAPLEAGLAQLSEVATTRPADDLDELCGAILSAALAGRDVQDDIAVLAVRLQPLGDRLTLRLPADPSVLAPLRATLRRWLSAAGAADDECFELLVACGEACTNAIRHATGPAAGPVERAFEVDAEHDGVVRITVRDQGRWREPRNSIGGRGIAIMERYVDELEILRGVDGTEVRMTRGLGSHRRRVSSA